MKKYELVYVDTASTKDYITDELTRTFNNLSSRGYHYHSFIPFETNTYGGFRSYFLVFEKDIEDKSNDF